ncbi:Uncharacterised protein [uncultured archaeon]|nr:Uncharacterised protein [uncultured archaeon]
MSFLLDPPMLFVIGVLLYFLGNKLGFERLAKITIGFLVVTAFILFSLLLYADIFRCIFPIVCNNMSGSEFMFHSDITGIYKKDVPLLVVIVLFALYPVWIYLGYASALLLTKRRRYSKELYSYNDVKSRKKPASSKYSIVRYPDIKQGINDPQNATRAAVDSLGGMKNFVKTGDKVLIKVNVCGGVPELKGTYTTKEVAGVVVDMVREAGGEPFICDADMVWTKFWPNAKAEGWIEWAKQKNVNIVNLSDTKIVNFDFGEDNMMPVERVSKEILDSDVIISIPAMKTHMMTGVTLGMKNMYGTLPEIDKARYHKIGIDEVIYYVNKAFTPNLTIIDGSIGGETVGPLSCDSVDYHTIITSNDVVTADSIAAQMMGFSDPIADIRHIQLAHENGVGDASPRFDPSILPYQHSSDMKWKRPDPDVAKFYVWGTHALLKLPGWDSVFSICSDFFLYDAARLPILKYFTPALLQIVNDVASWSLGKKPDSPENKKRRDINLGIFSILTLMSLFGFVSGGYLMKSSLYFSLGFLFSIISAGWFATRMKTKHFVAISLTSILISFLIERYTTLAGMWRYLDNATPPVFALFSTPLLVITIIGFSDFLRKVFSYVELSGSKLRNIPFVLMLVGLVAFMQFEGYLTIISNEVIAIYSAFAILGIFYNNKQTLDWNLAVASVTIGISGTMELLGSSSGLWGYHFSETMPVFLIMGWTMNVWAACAIAQIFGINFKEAIAD